MLLIWITNIVLHPVSLVSSYSIWDVFVVVLVLAVLMLLLFFIPETLSFIYTRTSHTQQPVKGNDLRSSRDVFSSICYLLLIVCQPCPPSYCNLISHF